jgi:LmbE family N-acetylglucosaminyl deacetylase
MQDSNGSKKGATAVIKTPGEIAQLGAVMFVGAHPDDELFTAGGILAAAARNGQRVKCLAASLGEAGAKPGWPKDMIGDIRLQELQSSLTVLGVRDYEWLNYQDGFLADVDVDEAVVALSKAVNDFKPDTILTFGPEGLTGHPDHRTVSRWVSELESEAAVYWVVIEPEQYEQLRAADRAANIFFKIKEPPLVKSQDCAIDLKLTAELTRLKKTAFEAVPSQMENLLKMRPFARPGEALARECFVKATK